jgi:spore germination protein GerM
MRRLFMILLCAGIWSTACTQADPDDTTPRTGVGTAATDSVSAGAGAKADTSDVTAQGTDSARAAPPPLTIHFSRGESTVTVARAAPAGGPTLEAALGQLLRGPTQSERAAGIHSWFSDTTAGALRSAAVDDAGHAVVDFADLRPLIPNASTSAGSAMLLRELNGTVFELPAVQSVEYRIEGNCARFWEWLQYPCEVVTRP